MPKETAIFDILRAEGAPAADHALLAALAEADRPTAQAIVEALLVRNQRAGLYGLVAAFHELDESIRQRVLEQTDDLFGVLRGASQSQVEQVRLNALEVIRRGCAYRAAYLVDTALHDRSARVREAAAETLYALADQLLRTSPAADRDFDHLGPDEVQSRMAALESYAEDRRQVVSAIESGLASFSVHLHPSVVEAAMWFVDDLGPRFWAVASVPGSRAAHVAISVMTGSKSTRLVPFCTMALNYGEFRPHVVKTLTTCTDPGFLAEWLRQSWRIVQPKVTRGMAGLKELACTENHGAELLQLPAEVQRHIPRWISATGISRDSKLDLLRELQRRGDRQARRSAAWALVGRTDDGATALLRTLAGSDSVELGRMARYELARRCPLEYPPSALVSMPEAGIRDESVWGETEPGLTFEKYWALFDQLSQQDRRRLGAEMLARHSWARAVLARRLSEAEASDRVRALCMIGTLGMSEEFADRLYQLSYDSHPMVRSAAIAALGQLPNASTKRILRSALSDEDLRVQANAVEAVARSGDKSATADLLAKLASPDNRVRANAVKALLKLGFREAAETLLHMLENRNRAQRISALWLIDHMGLFTLAARIVSIAESDEDAQVRDRAKALAERLVEQRPTPGSAQDTESEVASSTR